MLTFTIISITDLPAQGNSLKLFSRVEATQDDLRLSIDVPRDEANNLRVGQTVTPTLNPGTQVPAEGKD